MSDFIKSGSFFSALSQVIPASEIASKGGLSYLSAAAAVRLASLPDVRFVDFGSDPHLPVLNGALVAVDIPLKEGLVQRTWLPVMDRNNMAIPLSNVTVTDVNNARQRCLVKAIATTLGHGMSVFLGEDGNGAAAVAKLGLNPDSDLGAAQPVLDKLSSGGVYLSWDVALTAARIVDPEFHWEIQEWDGKPFREVLGGIMVDIAVTFKGRKQTLSLPVMNDSWDPVPASKASVWHWNKAVMRALSKAIAFTTGYGLSVYGEEFDASARSVSTEESASSSSAKSEKVAPPVVTKAATPAPRPAPSPAPAPRPEPKPAAESVAPSAVKAEAKSVDTVTATATATAPASVEPETPEQTRQRFKGVMQKRVKAAKGDMGKGLIGLFAAIGPSDKFPEDIKPYLYADLTQAIISGATPKDEFSATELLDLIVTHNGLAFVPQDSIGLVHQGLLRLCLNKASQNDEELVVTAAKLVEFGFADSLPAVIEGAASAGVPAETVELLSVLVEDLMAEATT